ncbi:Nitroreductase HBN1-like protein [Elsinoe fawcettii]|nr:Nitroreductase HBN1-like protein [Elsinoe fawcettii]
MASKLTLTEAVIHRRTIYQLNKTSPIPDSKILELVGLAAKHIPSSFDSQASRLVVLLGAEHDKFWDFVWDAVKPHVEGKPSEASSKGRIDGFKAAKGSILFFESDKAVQAIADKWKNYADRFPQWSEHSSAMHQYVLWAALEAEGLGANLQHYNPLIDDRVKKEYNLDDDWQLKAQLVFGGLPEGKKREELLLPKTVEGRDEKWVKVFGA